MNDDDPRPSPDALLREAAREGRGALKIFLGAAPGVGKTYEMLKKGAEKLNAGIDVVVGVVETHGRAETKAMLVPLEVVPRREIEYRGQTLTEMDLDAILERAPALVLVDELAHTNAPESRHPKRWQDIEELCAAGIDVWTTVNIQHLESLNDIVGGFTGVRVRETVPDRVFEDADIEVIDLSPDDLIARLKEGKIYLPQEAGRALENFFTKTKLSALRELALRRAAQAVDNQMLDQLRAGGVAANQTLRLALEDVTDLPFAAPPLALCTDNAAMIAFAGLLAFEGGRVDGMDLSARPRWPLDTKATPMIGSGKKGAKA